jgi:CRP-like cAMP-binding protein
MLVKKSPRETRSNEFSVGPIFLKFAKSGLGKFGELFEVLNQEKGDVFNFRRFGQEGFYLIESGLIKLEIVRPKPRILRLCRPGDLAGYGSWAADPATKYQLVALQDSKVQFWTRSGFEELQRRSPEVNELLIQHLIQIIIHKDERIAALESSKVENRIGHLVSWMAKNFGETMSDGTLIDLQLDRESMAQLAGTTPETLSRVLTQFEEENILRRKRRKLLVLDLGKLSKKL